MVQALLLRGGGLLRLEDREPFPQGALPGLGGRQRRLQATNNRQSGVFLGGRKAKPGSTTAALLLCFFGPARVVVLATKSHTMSSDDAADVLLLTPGLPRRFCALC